MRIVLIILFFIILSCSLLSNVFGAAFLIYNQDIKANSMGMAVSASIDNPSCVFYNPALMTEKNGFSVLSGDIMIYPEITYKDPVSNKGYETKTRAHHIPHIYSKYSDIYTGFGIGVYSLFGLSTEWSNNWSGRYNIIFAEIKTTFINPVISRKVNDNLSIGGGLFYVKSSVTFKSALNLFPLIDGISRLSGDGDGIGYNLAALIKFPKDYSLSFTYRSPVNIKYNGKAKFYLPAPLISNQTGATTKLTLPFLFVTGIAKKINNFVIESDILFTGWSSMNSYRIKSDNGMADGFFYKDWRNTITWALGVNYKINNTAEISTGYMLDRTPIPKRTLGPELPDSTRHIFTAGYSYKKSRFGFNMGYQATFFNNTRSHMKDMNGKYTGFAHLIMFGMEYGN
ncbi:MAG TPA: outer membrane protein transport protein [Syntrophorhabdaceae bacterium]|nr:outer membrane protein transport protein [Syntrophorhabdaceae bacterium]HPU29020.1 outer membrane protein transport protein [Syntrophorhabdaceae bacterium]